MTIVETELKLILHRVVFHYVLPLTTLVLSAIADASGPVSNDFSWPNSSLNAYLERALAVSPSLDAFKHRYEAALTRIPQASALPNPQFQVTHFVESIQTRTGPQENAFALSQRFPWFGMLSERERAAGIEAEALRDAWQSQNLRIVLETGTSYYDYALVHRQIDLVQRNFELLRQTLPSIEERVRGGESLDALLRLQVEAGRLDNRLSDLRSRQKVVEAKLCELLVLNDSVLLPTPELKPVETPTVDSSSLHKALERNNPELKMLRKKIESADAQKVQARLESYPDITLGMNYIQIDDPSGPMSDAGRDAWGVTVGISIPLWIENNRSVRLEAAEARDALYADFQQRLLTLKTEISQHITQLQNAAHTASLYGDELLKLAEQLVAISRTRYESGEGTLLAWIDSERSLLELELNYWKAVSDIAKHHLALQIMVNKPVAGIQISETRE